MKSTTVLSLAARPYFINPLRAQHADVGSRLTWRCEAFAVPRAVYKWLKVGVPNMTDT